MDPFHANLLLLQCQQQQRLCPGGPRPFDCALRLTMMKAPSRANSTAESKEHILFGHCQILGTKSALFRAQLDQSSTMPTIQFLLQLNNNSNSNAALTQGLAAAGALEAELKELKLDLSTISEQNGQTPSLDAFKQFVAFLYGEPIGPTMPNLHEQLLILSKLFAIPDLELAIRSTFLSQLLSQSQQSVVANSSSNSTVNFPMPNGTTAAVDANKLPPLYAAYLQLQSLLGQQSIGGFPAAVDLAHQNGVGTSVQQQQQQQQNASPLSSIFPSNPNHHHPLPFQQQSSSLIAASRSASGSSPEQQQPMLNRKESGASSTTSSIPSPNDGSMGNIGGFGNNSNNEMLVPSNDKEGWCRNKKYIQIVKKGYRCLLCNKIYGRYNSVSYHVTIYHRNPPIRCEEQGCQFTTREARYIHFHKYYRHQIALPESIDLASRKCPLIGCKHVSKSPAMLDKHVQRHVADCLKEGGIYACQMGGDGKEFGGQQGNHQQCQFTANGHELMYTHLLASHSLNRAVDVAMKSEEDGPPTLQMSSAGEVDNLLNLKKKMKENGGCHGISASAPNTPPTHGSNGTGAVRLHCQHCTFRGRTLNALEQHRMQKHRTKEAAAGAINQLQHPSPNNQLPPLPQSPFGPASAVGIGALNGIFGGLFPAFAAAASSSASLPGSPLSPNVGGVDGLFSAFPSPSLLEQQNAQQHLLAQMFAAQKLASLLVVISSPQQQQSQPATTNAMAMMNENGVAAGNEMENGTNNNML